MDQQLVIKILSSVAWTFEWRNVLFGWAGQAECEGAVKAVRHSVSTGTAVA